MIRGLPVMYKYVSVLYRFVVGGVHLFLLMHVTTNSKLIKLFVGQRSTSSQAGVARLRRTYSI